MTDITDKNSGNDKNGKSNEGGKSGKLQPKLRFKGFTDAWEQRALGDILVIHSSKDYIKDPDRVGEYEVIQQGNNPVAGYANGEPFKRYTEVILFGDHTVSLYRPQGPFFIATDGMKIIGAKANFRSTYLYFVLERYKPQSEGYKRHLGILKKTNVSISLGSREQECIGSLFRCLDSLIAAAERKVRLLRKKKHAYLNHIFTQHLRFTGHTTPWQTKKLGELERKQKIRLGRGKVISESDITSTPGKYPIYSSSARNNGEMGRYGLWMFNQELVTWSIDGGGSVFYRPKHRFSITNVCGFVQVLMNIDCPFLAYQMMYIHNKIHFDYTVKAHPSVIRKLYFLEVPNIEEQAKIGNFFQTLDSLITAAERKANLLKKKKQAYLQKMFI